MSTVYESVNMMVHGVGQAKIVVEPEGNEFLVTQLDLDESGDVWNVTPVASYRRAESAVRAVKWLEATGDFPQRYMVSIRQTRRGDWLVFQALPATLGIGVGKVGRPASGYKTGQQYGRFSTQPEAEAEAKSIAEREDGIVVTWEHPTPNISFSQLPRKYPTQTHYETFAEAEADGWVYVSPQKTFEHYRGHLIYARDVTPGMAVGYELAMAVKDHDRLFATNQMIWLNHEPRVAGGEGVFSYRFRTGDILDGLAATHRFIDSLE